MPGHLLFILRESEEPVVHPEAHKWRFARVGLGLGDFILVVREDHILAAAMDIQLLTEERQGHGRALDMPSRTAGPPGAVPRRLPGLGRLPENEVHGVLLARVDLDAGTSLRLVQRS